MRYEIITSPSVSGHETALRAQQARRTSPYPARLYDAHCDNIYRFVCTAYDSTLRAGYSLTGDADKGLFWYARGVDGRMYPLYGAPEIQGESDEKVAVRPML